MAETAGRGSTVEERDVPRVRGRMARLLALVDSRAVDVVMIAKLDRLMRSVADMAELLERFKRRRVSRETDARSVGVYVTGHHTRPAPPSASRMRIEISQDLVKFW